MALGYPVALRNIRLDAVTTFAGNSGKLRIYDGTRPATGGSIGAAVLLAELTYNATFAPAASGGVLTLNAIADDAAADATGIATWFRAVKSDGTTFVMDGSVSVTGGGGDLQLSTNEIVVGIVIAVTSFVITAGNA
jgi:hypothetical protein